MKDGKNMLNGVENSNTRVETKLQFTFSLDSGSLIMRLD
jgi:hypothetical protein